MLSRLKFEIEGLFQEIYNKRFPEYIFTREGITFADIQSAGLQSIIPVVEKLRENGRSDEYIRTHVYAFCEDELDLNSVQFDFSDVPVTFYIYNESIDMKFDVVVGNPPYQDPTGQNTLYPWFYSKAVSVTKDDGYIAMITPPAIIPGLWGLKDPDGIKMPEPLEINKIAVGNCVKDFFPGIASEFCYFILKNVKGSTNSQVCIKTDAGEIIANGPLFPKVIDSGSLTIAQSILNKCFVFYKDPYSATSGDHGKSARFDPAGQDLAVEAISTTGDLRTRPITWNKKHDHYNKPKVILPMYGKVAVIDYSHKLVSAAQEKTANGKLTGHNIMTVLTANDGESESLVQLLGSRLQRFFNTVTGETRAPYVNFLKNFIGVPLSTKYTDDDLETVLGLTPEEKEWISVNF